MPLDDLLPNLDDRTYDDIVGEIRTRIARYAPEWRPGASAWTDVNDNDPGVTITQVFAWLAEMLLYRMNRVPVLNYVKFLQLIGIELAPAGAAHAEITLPVVDTFADAVVRVPERAQFSADPGDGGPPLIFESIRPLVALRAKLGAIAGYDPDVGTLTWFTSGTDATSQAFLPLGERAPEGAWLGLGFDDSAAPPTVPPAPALPAETLDLAFISSNVEEGMRYTTCSGGNMSAQAPAKLAWEYNDAGTWRSLTVLRDDTLTFIRTGHILLKLPPKGIPATSLVALDPSDPLEPKRCWLRARVVSSQYEKPPALIAISTNTVEVEQAETIRGEVLGGSDGSRNQVFQLGNRPVLKGTLKLDIQVTADGPPQRWTEVEDLFGSGPTDNHYMLNRTTGAIQTGDGVNGNIPVAYAPDPGGNVVASEYRYGGGRRGNVPARTITTLVTSVAGIDASGVSNLLDANSGRDEETLDEVKKRAPHSLRSRDRAVTAGDFEYLASQAASVKRAKALPGFHPDFPYLKLPGVVSVIVVPDADPKEPMPMPSDGTLVSVCKFLDERRLLTTEVLVLKPQYQKIEVRADVVALDSADSAKVHDDVVQSLLDYFHPLRGGDDKQGWPFGGTIYFSRVYQRVFTAPGVASITDLTIVIDGEDQPTCTDIPIAPHGLLWSDDHTIVVTYAADGDA